MSAATPVATAIVIRPDADGAFEGSMVVDPDDPIFAGHYPGFPIYPGVCLAEVAHRVALTALGRPDIRLAEIESSRFLYPIAPGDRLLISGKAIGMRCAVDIHVAHQPQPVRAARVRLSFRSEDE
ncbi:FabA-like protein [Rhodococcus sp. AG1013]|uniref:ApeI family dehydratase n=1 Tax=Rhodococcus sp. AG1013 TaxID=2183996 RepID=UPI000E0C41F1|nr:hypothetical protein [Rhodococcus sp. AG1013]RDI17658.1 FabA-like protein [Rhodococcus sp. AG1013]